MGASIAQQGTFAFPEPSAALDRRDHMVALTNRAGDLRALRLLEPAVAARVRPYVRVVRLRGPRERVARARVRDWAGAIRNSMPATGLHLDLAEFDPALPVAGGSGRAGSGGRRAGSGGSRAGGPLLAVLAGELGRTGCRPVPVLRLDDGSTPARQLATTAAAYGAGNGLGLLVPLTGASGTGAEPVVRILETMVDGLALEPDRTDVLLELVLSPGESFRPAAVAVALDQIATVGRWRNVILLTSSVPATIPRLVEPVLAPIRANWVGWCELGSFTGDRQPVFADYGLRHPLRLVGPTARRANLRYTTAERTLIALTDRPRGSPRAGAFTALCRTVVDHALFAGTGCCWGCRLIEAGAQGEVEERQTQELWDTAGLVHHLTAVVGQLRALPY